MVPARLLYAEPSRALRSAITAVCTLASIGIAMLDYALGLEVSLIAAHAAPVGLAAWYGHTGAGYLPTAASALGLLLADRFGGTLYSSAVLAYTDSAINALTLAMLATLASFLRQKLRHERRISRIDRGTGALRAGAFRDAVVAETVRGQRFAEPCTLLFFHLQGGDPAIEGRLRPVVNAIAADTRAVDRIGRINNGTIAVLLARCSLADAQRVHSRLEAALPGITGRPLAYGCGIAVLEGALNAHEDATTLVSHAIEAAESALQSAQPAPGGDGFVHRWQHDQLERLRMRERSPRAAAYG